MNYNFILKTGIFVKGLLGYKAFALVPVFFLLLVFPTLAQKQDSTDFYIQSATRFLDNQQYNESLSQIRKVFSSSPVITDEVTFLYGKTMLGLKKYVLARDAFKDYLNKVESGEYSAEVKNLLEEAEKNICSLCNNTGTKEVEAECIKCSGKGHFPEKCSRCKQKGQLLCSVCKGKGVLIENNSMKSVFKDCSRCKGNGYQICPVCKGSLFEKNDCDICHGKGATKTTRECSH